MPTALAPATVPGRTALQPRVHDFRASLAIAEGFTDASWWTDLYRKAFPSMLSAVSVRNDGWAQRGGIDRVITLACGRVFTVDEKVRTNDWPDILLERWSDEERAKPGWIQKPLACDFIAYAFAPSRRCYLLPVAPLQRAWRLNGRHWIDRYGERHAFNPGYRSSNVPVPIKALMDAITAAMVL